MEGMFEAYLLISTIGWTAYLCLNVHQIKRYIYSTTLRIHSPSLYRNLTVGSTKPPFPKRSRYTAGATASLPPSNPRRSKHPKTRSYPSNSYPILSCRTYPFPSIDLLNVDHA